jgi:hypothetical protein
MSAIFIYSNVVIKEGWESVVEGIFERRGKAKAKREK